MCQKVQDIPLSRAPEDGSPERAVRTNPATAQARPRHGRRHLHLAIFASLTAVAVGIELAIGEAAEGGIMVDGVSRVRGSKNTKTA